MQSNRLVVTLNSEMQIGFQSGINQVYQNSYLVNDFVVRPSFLLAPSQSLWVMFQNAEQNPTVQLEPTLLAERKTTAVNSTQQVVDNDVSQIEQTTDTGYEYYMLLPAAILANPIEWYFSLEVREIPDSANPTQYSAIETSDFAQFTVNNSLAGATGGAPTELDILSLYNTTKSNAEAAAQSAQEAQAAASTVADTVQEIQTIVDNATEDITAQATQNATEATRQAVVDEANTRQSQIDAVNSDIQGLREDITNESHFRGYLATNAEIQALGGTPNDYAYSAQSGTVWIYQTATGWTDSGKEVPDQTTPASNATPLMDGEASAGSSENYARGDHRHPSDTNKADASRVAAIESKVDKLPTYELDEGTNTLYITLNS